LENNRSRKYEENEIETAVLLDADSDLKKEWNEKRLFWFNNIFCYLDYNKFNDKILLRFERLWPKLRWNSWDNSYSSESAKS
jgi:hypothetical protein